MAIRFTTTAESSNFVKCLVYGESGVGKTTLCKTAPKPVIISAESGLLSLKDQNIPVIEISSFEDFKEAYEFVTMNPKAARFETICLDSISDIAETILAEEKKVCGADPRQAYGSYADKLLPYIKKFRDIEDKHVYFTAKARSQKDGMTEMLMWGPSMPGQQLGPALPYLFDIVMALRIGETEDKTKFRYLQTEPDLQFGAKDRSGKLDSIEEPNLTKVFAKILGDLEATRKQPDSSEVSEITEEPGDAVANRISTEPSQDEEENQGVNSEESEVEEEQEEIEEEEEFAEIEQPSTYEDEEEEEEDEDEDDFDSAAEASMSE